MTTNNQSNYKNIPIRLQNWDYRWDASYFVTICTAGRTHYFGEICDRKMNLSTIGALADVFWHEIKNHAKNVKLGPFVVMPNHIHGIIMIDGNYIPEDDNKITGSKRFQNIGKNSLSSIIGSYKSAVTKHARRLGYQFEWQTRFYEHIIRDEQSFIRISDYIEQNVSKWSEDRFYDQSL